MANKGFKRKLTAILSADAVGYSRLMRNNEEATVRDIAALRVLISEFIQQHHGRVIDSPGDNILAEFASVVDAVNGAIKIQEEIKKRSFDSPDDRRMEFRIGINLGDVIEEEERIYGDGVNIAARVEGLAKAGGISISGTVYEHIKDKLSIGYLYLGEQDVKNIPEPVKVYRLLTEPNEAGKMIGEKKSKLENFRNAAFGTLAAIFFVVVAVVIWNYYIRVQIEPASLDKMAYPLPDKPSIAVLPFDNLSGDSDQDYIADGISENLISTLSKLQEMFVIARNSTFTYKGKAVRVQQVAEDLGVRYVLEGSVQKSGDKIRVTAQLIDAIAGHHLWSDKYDRRLQDLFLLLDDITHKVVVALQLKLTRGEQVRKDLQTNNLDAWSFYVKGNLLFENYTKAGNTGAREYFKRALKIDTEYVSALLMLAWTHFIDARMGFSNSPSESIKNAVKIAQKVSIIDENRAGLYSLWSLVYMIQRKYEMAIEAGKKSIEMDPNNASTYILSAMTMLYGGKSEEAAGFARQAIRLSPYCPAWYYMTASIIFRQSGYFPEAFEAAKKLFDRAQKGEFPLVHAHSVLAAIYAAMGKYEKARYHAVETMKINPDYSLEQVRKNFPYKNPADLELHLKYLREAGFK